MKEGKALMNVKGVTRGGHSTQQSEGNMALLRSGSGAMRMSPLVQKDECWMYSTCRRRWLERSMRTSPHRS